MSATNIIVEPVDTFVPVIDRQEWFVDFEVPVTHAQALACVDHRHRAVPGQGNLFSSEATGSSGLHAPVLDVDFRSGRALRRAVSACSEIFADVPGERLRLVRSTTNHHLYVESRYDWVDYVERLLALRAAKVISVTYFDLAIARHATFVRKPGVVKTALALHCGWGS